MTPVENSVIDTLLRVARRRKSHGLDFPSAASASTAEILERPVRRREAQFSDFEAVVALKERSGLSKDSLENWKRLWQENPALSFGGASFPIGWVQEVEENIVGFLGSVPLLYQYGDRTIRASATTSYAVDPEYRSRSLGMVGSFFRQEGSDLYLNTTATVAAGKIMQAFKAEQLPQKDYQSVLFWILDAQGFLHSVMKKLQVSTKLATTMALCGAPLLRSDIAIRKRRPANGITRRSCRELSLDEVGDDFQSLWLRKLKEKPRLLAWRTPEVLRWHFRIPNSEKEPQVLVCYEGNTLAGYAIVLTEPVRRLGLQKSSLADLFVADDKPEVITELLVGAYELALKNGSDVLEVMGFPEEVRRICRGWKPYARSYPACPFFYKTDRPDLRPLFAKADSWYASPYDGDTTLHA